MHNSDIKTKNNSLNNKEPHYQVITGVTRYIAVIADMSKGIGKKDNCTF